MHNHGPKLNAPAPSRRTCVRCGHTYPIGNFYKNAHMCAGYDRTCKMCRCVVNGAYRKTPAGRRVQRRSDARWRRTLLGRQCTRRKDIRRRSTPSGHLARTLSCALGLALRGHKAGIHWELLVGYTANDLRKHLEQYFEPGMSWANYGSVWHIDHAIAIARFKGALPGSAEFDTCWSLANLRPRFATTKIARKFGSAQIGNLNKGSRVLEVIA